MERTVGLRLARACALTALAAPAASAQCWEEVLERTGVPGDAFGLAVALDGDLLAVGAPFGAGAVANSGVAYLFERDQGGAGAWGQVAVLEALDGSDGDAFGTALSIAGDTVVVGAYGDDEGSLSGSTYVFERDLGGPGAWGQVAKLRASDGGQWFGRAVSVSADTLVVGDTLGDGAFVDQGTAYVFERDLGGPNAWGEVRKLVASDAAADAAFGYAVSISADTLVVGARLDDEQGVNAGAAYVFERDLGGAAAWGEATKLTGSDIINGFARFGQSVSIFQDAIVVGAFLANSTGFLNGSAYLYERDLGGPGAWGEARVLLTADGGTDDEYGFSVSVMGDVLAVGAPGDDTNGQGCGSAYVFERGFGSPDWGQLPELGASNGAGNDRFGHSVAVSGDTLAVGARIRTSVYVFERAPAPAVPYCTASTSISGCQAALTACGAASASASSGFVLWAGNVEGVVNGMFYFAANGRQALPWSGGGFQCVVPPVRRAGLLAPLGDSDKCNGAFAQDLNALWCATCPKPTHNPGAGAVVQAQLWYRDPPGTRLSSAIEFLVAP